MFAGVVIALLLSGSPQGVAVQVNALEAPAPVKSADAQAVTEALKSELSAQGYDVRAAKGQAFVTGTLTRDGDGPWKLHLALVRQADQAELGDVSVSTTDRAELRALGSAAAKQLASELRQSFGVKATFTVKPAKR